MSKYKKKGMSKYKKLVRDGEVAVLYSPGYGAGWFSWNSDEGMLFDSEIVEAILDNNRYLAAQIAEAKYDAYAGGVDQLQVAWLPEGTLFRIEEYDGSEHIVTHTNDIYIKA